MVMIALLFLLDLKLSAHIMNMFYLSAFRMGCHILISELSHKAEWENLPPLNSDLRLIVILMLLINMFLSQSLIQERLMNLK